MTQRGLARLDRWLWRVTLPCLLLDIRSVIVQQQGSILITGIEVELLAYVLSRGRESDCFVKPADGSTDIIALSTGEFWEYSSIILLLHALRIRDCYSHLFPEDCCALKFPLMLLNSCEFRIRRPPDSLEIAVQREMFVLYGSRCNWPPISLLWTVMGWGRFGAVVQNR